MTSLITPWFRTFFTDIFGTFGNFQEHPVCAEHELRVVDCLEAYGVINGKTKCRVLLDDFRECVLQGKRIQRIRIMQIERKRQIENGELDEENGWAPPPRVDAY